MVAHHMYLRRIQEKSIIRISGGGGQIVLLSMIELLAGKYLNLDREVVHVPLVGLNRTEHVTGNEVDLELGKLQEKERNR